MPNLFRRWRIRRTYRALCEAFAYSKATTERMAWWRERYRRTH